MTEALGVLALIIFGGGFWLVTKGRAKTVWGVVMIIVGALGFIALCSAMDISIAPPPLYP